MTTKRQEVPPGTEFGRLVAIEEVEATRCPKGHKIRRVRCKCQCKEGNVVIATLHNLRSGTTQSCGCLRKKAERLIFSGLA